MSRLQRKTQAARPRGSHAPDLILVARYLVAAVEPGTVHNQDQNKNTESSYPLHWPVGWPRCKSPDGARFSAQNTGTDSNYRYKRKVIIAEGRERILLEMNRLGATGVLISTNVPTRQDGMPYSNATEPKDHGVAVYFRLKGEPRVLACDKWDRVADNLVALAKHVEAVRGQVRWGVGSLEQAFGGYKALPEVGARREWWEVLGVDRDAPLSAVKEKRDELLARYHPDLGGDQFLAAEVNCAFDAARAARIPTGAPVAL